MKILFYISIVLNVLGGSYYLVKRFYYLNYDAIHASQPINKLSYNYARSSLFTLLPVDSNDIVFVGNSLTEGFQVTEMFGQHFKNRGINGNRLIDIIDRIGCIVKQKPRTIFVEGGINDISGGDSPDIILQHYVTLINKIRTAGINLVVQSILPTSKVKNQKAEIAKTNNLVRNYCLAHDIAYIDLYPEMQQQGYLIDSLTYDGLHLNGNGYAIWQKHIRSYFFNTGKKIPRQSTKDLSREIHL